MSGVSYFLSRQKKGELVELAENLGLSVDGLRKTDLEVLIEEELSDNASKHSGKPQFAQYYARKRSEGSPVKQEGSTTLDFAETKAKVLARRVTRGAEEFTATDDSDAEAIATRARSALVATPRRVTRLAQNVPLPPSPAVLADAIDRRTLVLREKIADYYEESGIIEARENTREALSSVVSVHAIIIAFELYKLRPEILADRDAFMIPAIEFLHTNAHVIRVPDMFLLLTASFWAPALTWFFTAFLIPLAASYFINLTSKPKGRSHTYFFDYSFDPLTFNIVKALMVFVVFAQGVTFGGWIDPEQVARIRSAVYGGHNGILVGTGIGALVTLYEAIRR